MGTLCLITKSDMAETEREVDASHTRRVARLLFGVQYVLHAG